MTEVAIATLADDHVRLRALDPQQSFIVQAPAGSGKTELLTQRYLQLLAHVDTPEQILAITFTRKAASEMRNRILQSLARCRECARPDASHEAHNWELAQAALQADAQRGWQLETHPARLRIQTIDSLNAHLARRLPMLAQMGASMEIAQDQWPIYEAVCERLLQQLGDGSSDAAHLETVLLHLANRVTDFVKMLCDLLARRDHWLPLLMAHRNDHDLRASIEATLRAAVEHHLQRVCDAISIELQAELVELAIFGATHRLNIGAREVDIEFLKACAALSNFPDPSADQLPAWRGLATVICKKDGEFYSSLTKTQGFGTEHKPIKQRMLALLNVLRDIPDLAEAVAGLHTLPAMTFDDNQWQVLQALLQLLPRAVSELMLEFQARGQVDYVELSLRALRALGSVDEPTDTALALDARLQHILVDEFQDTSITQMQLLRLLTAGWSNDGRTLFCVGDPMQSIYRFRQAEVGLFLEMQAQGLPGIAIEALHLQTNFRSTQPIVDWVNRCFAQVMPRRDDAESGAVHYRATLARPNAAPGGMVRMHAAVNRSVQQEARDIATLVHTLLQTEQRIAILVTGRSHVGAIATELKLANIDFNAVDIERLQDRSLVQDLIALTRALVHLGDRTAWLACLRAPWCGLPLEDLHAVAAAEAQRTIMDLLSDAGLQPNIREPQRLERFLDVMNAALMQRARLSLRDWVERTWLALNGPACLHAASELDDAEAYFARLDELEVAGDLEDVTRLEPALNKLFAHSGNQNARVEIMTIHKSKGLEFDAVILPSLHRIGGHDSTHLLRWTRLTGLSADGLVIAPPGAKGEPSDAIYHWLALLEKQRAHHESGRLLYVAATRAKRELHLFGSTGINKEGDAPTAPVSGSLLSLLWPQMQAEFVAAVQAHRPDSIAMPTAAPLLLKRLPLEWRPPPAGAALVGKTRDNIINIEPPEFDWVGETSRHIGTVVHAELERLVKLSAEQMQQWNGRERQPQLVLQLAELGVPEALRATACERVVQAVTRTLNDARGRWILGIEQLHEEAHSELALTGVIDNDLINGIIDRSFVDAQGTRWIIDFKTSAHEGGGREAFLQSEVERYRAQMTRYAMLMRAFKPEQPIKAALYFPLLGEWREIKIVGSGLGLNGASLGTR